MESYRTKGWETCKGKAECSFGTCPILICVRRHVNNTPKNILKTSDAFPSVYVSHPIIMPYRRGYFISARKTRVTKSYELFLTFLLLLFLISLGFY
jgi:hypothetical protein